MNIADDFNMELLQSTFTLSCLNCFSIVGMEPPGLDC